MELDFTSIGKAIRKKRKQLKYTQAHLSALTDLGVTYISHIESGSTIPSLKTFVNILNSLDLSADEVLRGPEWNGEGEANGSAAGLVKKCGTRDTLIITDTVTALNAESKFRLRLRGRTSPPW